MSVRFVFQSGPFELTLEVMGGVVHVDVSDTEGLRNTAGQQLAPGAHQAIALDPDVARLVAQHLEALAAVAELAAERRRVEASHYRQRLVEVANAARRLVGSAQPARGFPVKRLVANGDFVELKERLLLLDYTPE